MLEYVRVMKRELDHLLVNEKLKQEFRHDKMFLQAVKSYVKNNWKYICHILKNFHDLNYIIRCKKDRCWWLPDVKEHYTCLEAEYLYKVKDILEVFLREYVEELFRFYEHYCENQSELK